MFDSRKIAFINRVKSKSKSLGEALSGFKHGIRQTATCNHFYGTAARKETTWLLDENGLADWGEYMETAFNFCPLCGDRLKPFK